MYGLPDDFDPGVFVGRRLESITFAENVIVLTFSEAVTVSIAGTVLYQEAADTPQRRERPLTTHTGLVGAGGAVESTELKSPRELILRLEKGFLVTLVDDSDEYESYLIALSDREIVVRQRRLRTPVAGALQTDARAMRHRVLKC